MNNTLNECHFEEHIATALAASPMYVRRQSQDVDLASGCDRGMLEAFLREQTEAWWRLAKQYGEGRVVDMVIREYNRLLDTGDGMLKLLQKGITLAGIKIKFVQFSPGEAASESSLGQLYRANRFAVVRQLHYSADAPERHKSLDLCIMINGLPIITCELKNQGTGQCYVNGIEQYRKNRRADNRLLRNCLVHFVLDNNYAFMTTQLANEQTRFLPFNKDSNNPPVAGDYPTSYMWREIWQAESLLDLIQNFIKQYRGEQGDLVTVFPRYHQLRAVRKLRWLAHRDGPGHNYLIQHSAGSGKTKSMAWLAHQLANMIGPGNKPLFDSIVMVTDRIVLNRNMADDVINFETTAGTVKDIRRGSKNLATSLDEGNRIIISTVQKFAYALKDMKRATSRTYAVVIDEAHTAIGQESAKDIAMALTTDDDLRALPGYRPEEYESPVDALMAYMQTMRGAMRHISYFAFTATPKDKTFLLYGEDGKRAHDVYSMKQAIDEHFILDVLQNYVNYKTMIELAPKDPEQLDDGKVFKENKALKVIYGKLEQDPDIMKRKAEIVVDHLLKRTCRKIDNRGKAMLVCSSRRAAAEYMLVVSEMLRQLTGGDVRALVAFSGEVEGRNGRKYSESTLNDDGVADDEIRRKFEGDMYRLLIVAEKFQTGFDQPLLHTMFVDRKLGGIQCVQTLSRLNRCCPGKDDTLVIDFRNDRETVCNAFQAYYAVTMLEGEADVQHLYSFKSDIEACKVFTPAEVEEVVSLLALDGEAASVPSLFARIVEERFKPQSENDQDRFRKLVNRYVRQYGFMAQLMDFLDPDLEKFYVFCKAFYKYLPYTREALPMELVELVNLDKLRVQLCNEGALELKDEDHRLQASRLAEPPARRPEDELTLKELLDLVNEPYAGILDENDAIIRPIADEVYLETTVREAFYANNSNRDLVDLVYKHVDEKIADQIVELYKFDEWRQKNPDAFMKVIRALVDLYIKRVDEIRDLPYDEQALKQKLVDVFQPEFAEVLQDMHSPLEKIVDMMFVVINTETDKKFAGLRDVVKRALNEVYMAPNLPTVDRQANFIYLVAKYEAFLKKLYGMCYGKLLQAPHGAPAMMRETIQSIRCLAVLRNHSSPKFRKFAEYLEQVCAWRNSEAHMAPQISKDEAIRGTNIVVAMYIYAVGGSLDQLFARAQLLMGKN